MGKSSEENWEHIGYDDTAGYRFSINDARTALRATHQLGTETHSFLAVADEDFACTVARAKRVLHGLGYHVGTLPPPQDLIV